MAKAKAAGSARYLNADGTERTDTKAPTLPEAQAYVGGYIELVTVRDAAGRACQLLMNEDGLRFNLPINATASAYWHGPVVGNAILLSGRCKWT